MSTRTRLLSPLAPAALGARLWSQLGLSAFVAASALPACGVVKPLGDDQQSQSSSDGTGNTSSSSSANTGVDCGTDSESGVSLCLGTTECPDVKLDTDAFPACGFQTTSGTYDIECVCNGNELCPVGVATSCTDVTNLFAQKSLADFCNQGACKEVGSNPTMKPTTQSPNCDPSCAADCAGAALCIQACGC